MKFLKSERGFGLLETVISIAILGAVAATFLTSNSVTYKAMAVARHESNSQRIAQIKMEAVKKPYNAGPPASGTEYDRTPQDSYAEDIDESALDSIGTDYPGYTVRVRADLVPGIVNMNEIQKITITIKINNVETFTLVDYKVNR